MVWPGQKSSPRPFQFFVWMGGPEVVDVPFKRLAIDLIGPFKPTSRNGFRYVLTVIDVATRFPEAIPLRNIDTISVAEALATLHMG
ncbi:hypothetical protein ACOMHN_030666 [Nucella lapillus]